MLTNLALVASMTLLGSGTFLGSGPSAEVTSASLQPCRATVLAPSSTGAADSAAGDAASAVSIKTQDNLLLKATFYAPKVKKRSQAPAALLLHDQGRTREELDALASYLHKRGFAVLTIDLRGHGESVSDEMDFEKADEKSRESMWTLAARDIEAGAAFLLEQEGVHSSNLSLVGFGSAACLAVRRAGKDANVRAVVLVEPELETYGYDLSDGVADLGGLPTMVVATEGKKDDAKKVKSNAEDKNSGLKFVDMTVLKCDADAVLDDKKLMTDASGWLRDQAMPKK